MLRLILWIIPRLLLAFILYQLVKRFWIYLCGAVQSEGGLPPRPPQGEKTLVRDPECGLNLPREDALTIYLNDEALHFCSRECRDAYLAKQKGIPG